MDIQKMNLATTWAKAGVAVALQIYETVCYDVVLSAASQVYILWRF